MANLKPTAQTGALTLVLLVQMYRSQMIALLVKNGIVVDNNASNEQITSLMTNLLKVSKSFSQDLSDFITNPAVANAIVDGMGQTAQYVKISGNGYLNAYGDELLSELEDMVNNDPAPTDKDPIVGTNLTPPKKGFLSGFNLPDFLNSSMQLFSDYSKGKSDVEIAKYHALSEQAKAEGKSYFLDPTTGEKIKIDGNPKDEGLSTTTIVALSLGGVALLWTIIYFIVKAKK